MWERCEGCVALLPCEWVAFLVRPARGIRFDGENRVGQGQGGWNLDEEMNVIFRSAHGVNKNVVVFANTCRVGPDLRLKFLGDGFAAVFGAEDNMNYVLRVCVGHVPHLRCWGFFQERVRRPTLKNGGWGTREGEFLSG